MEYIGYVIEVLYLHFGFSFYYETVMVLCELNLTYAKLVIPTYEVVLFTAA